VKETAYSNGWDRVSGGIMTCDTREPIPDFKDLGFISHEFVLKYNCDDACYNANTHHPFHDKSSVVARLDCNMFTWTTVNETDYACFAQCPRDNAEDCWFNHDGWTDEDFRLQNVGYYGFLPVAVFELFFVLCFGRMSPEEIRDQMFRFMFGKSILDTYKMMSPGNRTLFKKRSLSRIRMAQLVALLFYIFAVLTYVVYLPFFIASIAWQERLLRFSPDAENPNEVGQ